MGYISYVRRVIANFVLKFAIFRYHGNRVGLSKFVWHPQMSRLWIPPKWCRYLGYMPYTTWVIAIFVLKFAHFRYHGNRGQSEKFLPVTFKQADPPAPYWVEVHGLYLINNASYSQFCVKICDFSLPWQQGRSKQFFTYTSLLAVPDNRTIEPKITTLSYIEPELWLFKFLPLHGIGIFSNFRQKSG